MAQPTQRKTTPTRRDFAPSKHSPAIPGPVAIRTQIGFIIAGAVFVCALIAYVGLQNDKSFLERKTREFQENQLNVTANLAEKARLQLERLNDALLSLSQTPAVQFLERNECLLLMIKSYRLNEHLVDAIIRVNKINSLVYSYPNTALTPTADELDPVFQQARLTGKPVAQVLRSEYRKSHVLVIARPVYTVQGEVRIHPNNKFTGLI